MTPTFHEQLQRHARARPTSPALVSPARTLSYGELFSATHALALELRDRGVEPGAVVAITVRGEVDHLLVSLALLSLGAPQLTLASHESAAMRERYARRIGATHVVGDLPGDGTAGLRWIDAGRALGASRERASAVPLPAVDALAPAIFIAGSGTTGEPKILRFSQHQIALQTNLAGRAPGERALRAAHVQHNAGKRNRLYSLWGGRTCVLAEGEVPLRDVALRLGATSIEAPPLPLADLVVACRRHGAIPGVSLRSGGTMIPWALRRDLIEHVSPRLHVGYGMTEAGVISVAGPGRHDERESVGPPITGAEVRILDADGAITSPGDVGEISVRTPGMATGYFDDPDETRRRFRDGWFLPGDLVSMSPDGDLKVHGRADDMMILNSINIFPSEIERVLEGHPAVAEAAAFPVASPSHGQIPIAAIALRAGAACGSAELLAFARERLGLRAPRRIAIVDALPRNPQGKVLRRELVQRFGGAAGPDGTRGARRAT